MIVKPKIIERDEQDISIVYCNGKTYDISSGEHDIATLGGLSSDNLGKLIEEKVNGNIKYSAEKNPESMKLEKIKNSQRADIFYNYYGFDKSDISRGQGE